MDVDAGHGAALGRALSPQAVEIPLLRRLRSMFSWPGNDQDPVSALTGPTAASNRPRTSACCAAVT